MELLAVSLARWGCATSTMKTVSDRYLKVARNFELFVNHSEKPRVWLLMRSDEPPRRTSISKRLAGFGGGGGSISYVTSGASTFVCSSRGYDRNTDIYYPRVPFFLSDSVNIISFCAHFATRRFNRHVRAANSLLRRSHQPRSQTNTHSTHNHNHHHRGRTAAAPTPK